MVERGKFWDRCHRNIVYAPNGHCATELHFLVCIGRGFTLYSLIPDVLLVGHVFTVYSLRCILSSLLFATLNA